VAWCRRRRRRRRRPLTHVHVLLGRQDRVVYTDHVQTIKMIRGQLLARQLNVRRYLWRKKSKWKRSNGKKGTRKGQERDKKGKGPRKGQEEKGTPTKSSSTKETSAKTKTKTKTKKETTYNRHQEPPVPLLPVFLHVVPQHVVRWQYVHVFQTALEIG
jgi:hypothetical protein